LPKKLSEIFVLASNHNPIILITCESVGIHDLTIFEVKISFIKIKILEKLKKKNKKPGNQKKKYFKHKIGILF
jgi:hypothetical protein